MPHPRGRPTRRRRTRARALVAGVVAVLVGALVPVGPARAVTGAVAPVHDPTIVRDGDTWWAFSTGPRLPILRSDDLEHWTAAGEVFADGLPGWLTARI
ncbi:MAG: hypothetical protein KDB36_14535, partial [Acidimicrobiales bacterium]|nr:hypothetical protein [Acidimicrobiales bacterium]